MMSQDCFQAANWYQALKLTERVASLGVSGRQIAESGHNAELAERRIQRWRSQNPFTKSTFFAIKLAQEGITEQEFRFLLGEPMRSLPQRFPTIPEWLREIEQAFSTADRSNLKSVITSDNFLCAIAPLIHQGINRLQAGLQAIEVNQNSKNNPEDLSSQLPFDANTILSILLADLPQQLLWMLTPTMVLELNVARLQELLSGKTAQERYVSFLQRLQEQDVAIQLLQDYPVLARQLALCIQQHIEVKLEFIQRLCTDWAAIYTAFSPDKEPGVLEQINCSISDSHNGGRSVIIAKFQSGFKVVYKPKPLAVDVHFQDLLYWINQKAVFLPLKPLKIINCGTYGWVEFIESSSCSHRSQIERFYQRMGGYLALLYALDATDFHLENLIASGEHPMPIDLETLFQPRKIEPNSPEAIFIANQRMAQSVFRIGLLPQRLWRQGESAGIEVSGIGATDGQIMPERILTLAEKGTDEMRMTRQQIPLPESKNRPRLHEAQVNVLDYKESIITGFTTIYQFLMKHQDELLAQDGLLTRFASDEVRVVLRESRTYALLLRESFHPDVLRDALNRDRLFDRLWVDVDNRSYLAQLIKAEQESLWQGDIPKFTTYPNSRELRLNEQKRIPDFFEISGMEQVQHRIQMEQGRAWMPEDGTNALTGFSHGAAGMAWALLELATLTGEERFRSSAVAAITYERSLFSPDAKNWLNSAGEQDTFSVAWSHGAPGIGLARLHSLKHLDDAQIPLEINTALETTLAHGFCGNHSLCNGMLGNLEFLLQASQTPNYSTWHSSVTRLTASILESLHQQGWCCGVPLGVETLGLMTGLAGIGYGLLRLAAPQKIPSILVLSPPNTILD